MVLDMPKNDEVTLREPNILALFLLSFALSPILDMLTNTVLHKSGRVFMQYPYGLKEKQANKQVNSTEDSETHTSLVTVFKLPTLGKSGSEHHTPI